MFIKDLLMMPLYEDGEAAPVAGEEEIVEEITEAEETPEGEEEIIEEIPEEEEKPEEEEQSEEEEETEEQKKDSLFKQIASSKEGKKFLKEHPELRTAYFENKQFKEVFTSVEDAKEAATQSEILQKISAELQQGDPKEIINYLKEAPEVLTQFSRNLIKNLPPQVLTDAIAPSVINLLKEVKEAAKLHKNEDLENSVGWISKYLFNNHELPEIKDKPVEKKEEVNPLLAQVEKNFNEEVVDDVKTELNNLVDLSLASLKAAKPSVKKSIANDIKEELDKVFDADIAHKKLMSKLWQDAKKSNFSKQAKASIKSAYLAAVKKRLPEVRITVLKNNGFKVTKGQKKAETEGKTPEFRKVGGDGKNTSSSDDKIQAMKKSGASERAVLDAILSSKA